MTNDVHLEAANTGRTTQLGCVALLAVFAACLALLWMMDYAFGSNSAWLTGAVLLCAYIAFRREDIPGAPARNTTGFISRWIMRTFIYMAGASAAIFATLIWDFTHFDHSHSSPPHPLTTNIHGTMQEVRSQFDARIQSNFKLGTSDADMGTQLQSQGFARTDWRSSINDEHEATLTEYGFPCRTDWVVHWRVDATGKLTAIHGDMASACL